MSETYYFSNGTEGQMWMAENCERCVHDLGGDCPHLLNMLIGEYDPVFIRVPHEVQSYDVLQCTELTVADRG